MTGADLPGGLVAKLIACHYAVEVAPDRQVLVRLKKYGVPVQSCEGAVLALAALIPKTSLKEGMAPADQSMIYSFAMCVHEYGRLHGGQLDALRHDSKTEGFGQDAGPFVRHAGQLTDLGFDLERLFDQVPVPPEETVPAHSSGAVVAVPLFKVVKQTLKAWLVEVAAAGTALNTAAPVKEIWVPKSLCKIESQQLLAPRWLLTKKGVLK